MNLLGIKYEIAGGRSFDEVLVAIDRRNQRCYSTTPLSPSLGFCLPVRVDRDGEEYSCPIC